MCFCLTRLYVVNSSAFQVWNLSSIDPNFTLEGHLKGVNCVDYFTGGDKPYLISGSDDQTAKASKLNFYDDTYITHMFRVKIL